jgi:hypothetical protein
MQLFETTKSDFRQFIEKIYLNGINKEAKIIVEKDKVKAVGSNLANTLYFDVSFNPTILNEGSLLINDLSDFLKYIGRADDEFKVIHKENELFLKGTKVICYNVSTNDDCVTSMYAEGKEFNKDSKIFVIEGQTYKFTDQEMKDLSDIDFESLLSDFRTLSTKDMQPQFIFIKNFLLIQNLMTNNSFRIALNKAFFDKEAIFNSGIIQDVFKLKPSSLKMFCADDLFLIEVDENSYYIIVGSQDLVGDISSTPFN